MANRAKKVPNGMADDECLAHTKQLSINMREIIAAGKSVAVTNALLFHEEPCNMI
jgi:hypothetical protein